MRHIRISPVIFLLIAFVATPVFADTVSMKFIAPGGNNSGGVYTYPYNFSINGSPTYTPLVCDAYNNEITMGESWTATVTPLVNAGGMWGSSDLLDYKAAGLIFEGMAAGWIDPNAGNWAIWGLFASNAQSNSAFISSGAAGLEANYLAQAWNAPNSWFNGLVIYTPVAGTQSWGRTPQEFIGCVSVPEPGELSLMGLTFLTLVGALIYKQRLVAKPAAAA
jgi:hypothetical protein